jgi:hypothetical protein
MRIASIVVIFILKVQLKNRRLSAKNPHVRSIRVIKRPTLKP